jgi:hypothetical protein
LGTGAKVCASLRPSRSFRSLRRFCKLSALSKIGSVAIPGVAILIVASFWTFLNASPAGMQLQSMATAGLQSPATPLEAIGRLFGDDVSITGAVTFDAANGRSTALLSSGSDLTIRSGQAKVSLVEGGQIAICGPAHLSLLKSGNAITLALDYGRVHPELNSAVSLMIYTPLIVATPVGIAQDARDITVGLDVGGEMCALADRGAVRIEQQLSGQSLLVPEGGQLNLRDGELNPVAPDYTCTCELPVAQNASPVRLERSTPAHAPIASAPPPVDASTAAEPPIYRVDMPPLTFSASSPAPPPDADPQTITMVRESRVQPDTAFQGHIVAAPAGAVAAKTQGVNEASTSKKHGVFSRFFSLFRSHSAPAS